MFDRAGFPDLGRYRIIGLVGAACGSGIGPQRAAGVSRLAQREHLARLGHGDDAQCARKQAGDIFDFCRRLHDPRIRTIAIGLRNQAFAVGHDDPIGRHPHARGIPSYRDEPQRATLPAAGNIDHGQVVGIGVGHPEGLGVGRSARLLGVLPCGARG